MIRNRASSTVLFMAAVALGVAGACKPTEHAAVPGPADPPSDPKGGGASSKERIDASLASQGLSAEAMDRSVAPCDDFYQYACGGWEKTTEIPADRSNWSRSFSEIDKRNEADLHDILEAATKKKAEDSQTGKIGRFYATCMDQAAIDKAGAAPLKPMFDKINKVKDKKQLTALVVELHEHGIWAFWDLSSGQDYKDATKMIGMIDQNGLGLPDRDYYLKDDADKKKIRDAYSVHVEKILVLSGLSAAQAKTARDDVLRIETALATVSKTREERRDPVAMYNKVDKKGLIEETPIIDWDAYFKGLGSPTLTDISVSSPAFMKGMNEVIKKETPAALKNYLTWQVAHYAAPRLSKAFDDEDFAMTQVLTGQKEQRERWKRCIDATDMALGEYLALPFIALRFAGESKTAAEGLVKDIQNAMGDRLGELDWMDEATRTKAKEKLGTFANLIGYPAKTKSYDFAVKDNAYFDNAMAGAEFKLKDSLSKIGKPVDRGEWYMTAPTVNAYYDPQKNQMVFPAGILQPPFYSKDASVPVNLGAMGMVVGHELTHGFDDEGSQFDKLGNLSNWWSPDIESKFKGKGACVARQYDGYEVLPGVHLNGKLTLGENIADAGGMKLAFRAYRNRRHDSKQEVMAEGLSEDQQFFLAAGQIWCSKYRDQALKLLVATNPHSYPKFRVNGPMSQMPEFAQAFQCKPGAKMIAKESCPVW